QGNAIVDIFLLPESHERRGIVGVQAGDDLRGSRVECAAGVAADAELTDMHAVDSSPRHGCVDRLGNGAEIFTDDLHPVAVRFEIQYRVELRRAVVNVDAVNGAKTIGYPKGAMQPHHMVDA